MRNGRYAWPRGGVVAAILLAGLAIAGDSRSDDPTLPPPPKPDLEGRTARPVLEIEADVDLRIDGETEGVFRLLGVYVPHDDDFRFAARDYLERLLEGESVYIVPDPQSPPAPESKIQWAYIYRAPDGLPVNLELVRLGYARVIVGTRFEQQELFRQYEAVARRAQKGIWSQSEGGPARGPAPTTRPRAEAAGRSEPPASQPTTRPSALLVYVTTHGKKYHQSTCQHARNAVAITIQDARARGFTPCERCRPPG